MICLPLINLDVLGKFLHISTRPILVENYINTLLLLLLPTFSICILPLLYVY